MADNEEGAREREPTQKTQNETKPRESIQDICASTTLDDFLNNDSKLCISYQVPHSVSADYVSERTTGMPLPDFESVAIGVMAGLGIKRKTANIVGPPLKKAKTLSEKREALEQDILKYGVAAIEKMYPRQTPRSKGIPGRRGSNLNKSLTRMKPKPSGVDFEEVDARDILKPHSHDKYIHQPPYDSVVFITRRTGLVPLSSLCKDATTVMSSNVKLLKGRNVRLGKPSIFLKEKGRLLAIGGSRGNAPHFNITSVPSLEPKKLGGFEESFVMDSEYVDFALKAMVDLPNLSKCPVVTERVDVRELKRRQREEDERKAAMTRRDVINKIYDKVITHRALNDEQDDDQPEETINSSEMKTTPMEQDTPKPNAITSPVDNADIKEDPDLVEENSNLNDSVKPITKSQEEPKLSETPMKTQECSDASENDEENEDPNRGPIHQQWKDHPPIPRSNPLDIETKAIVSEAFKKAFEERKKNPIAGFDACDVENCYCKEKEEPAPTCSQTPTSGSQTPSGTPNKNGEKKTKTRLHKVKRALKSLGVNFYEFDEADQVCIKVDCDKVWCRFGCICDCISGKAIPPSHCGKVECMFHCTCSEDTATYASSKKVGISPAGAANLRTSSQRHLAAEERKFHNTVISSGKDVVLLGSSGRTKRERKIPSRYQDAESVMSDHCGRNLILVEKNPDIRGYSVLDKDAIRTVQEHLENETIQACTVLVPRLKLPSTVKPWCMIHCQYNCPCGRYKDPLDYGPDVNLRKMVSKPKGPKLKSTVFQEDVNIVSEDNQYQHSLNDYSARTFGYKITPSDGLKPTHKVVVQKVPKMDLLGPLNSKNIPDDRLYSNRIHLEARPKGAIQYVKWTTLKEEFDQSNIKLYLYERVSRSLVFITKAADSPYVIDAINLKDIPPVDYVKVPQQIRDIFRAAGPGEGCKYAILTHNGLAWEFSGTIERRSKSDSTKKTKQPVVETSLPTNINGDTEVQKLALGRNLITLERSGLQTMQIKLPPTSSTQHWFIIRIDKESGSIHIPDTTLALKTAVLKQAAALAKKESTTVRIPIPVSKEVSHFGVYAVPGLDTHVFVGPFSVQKIAESPKEVIDLEDDEEIQEISDGDKSSAGSSQVRPAPSLADDDDDDIQVLSDTLNSKDHLKAVMKENNQVVNELLTSMSDQAVIYGETKIQREMKRNVSVSGSVPNVVSKGCETEVVTIEESSSISPSGPIGPNFNAKTVPYTNLPTSQFGKIVYNSSANSMTGDIIMLHVGNRKVVCRKRPSGMVTFPHPTFPNHFVFCSSTDNAGLWIKEFTSSTEETSMRKKPPTRSPPRLAIKPMSSLIGAPLASKPNGKKEQLVGVSSFINPSGSQGLAYLLNSKSEHAELSKLFYELAVKTCRMKPTKQLSQSQILSKAMDEIQMLKAEERVLETTKTKLKLERRDVFTKLKNALIGAPKEEKKRVLMSVKAVIKQLDLEEKDPDGKKGVKSSSLDQANSSSAGSTQIPDTTPPIQNPTILGKGPSNNAWLNGLEANPIGATPYSDVTGLQTLKRGKISRPMNAFMLWAKDHRKNLIANGYDGATVSKLLADEWKTLSAEKKSDFYKESERLKSLHQLQHPNYKFSPKARKTPLTKKPWIKEFLNKDETNKKRKPTLESPSTHSAPRMEPSEMGPIMPFIHSTSGPSQISSPGVINIRIPTLRNPGGEAIPLSNLAQTIQDEGIISPGAVEMASKHPRISREPLNQPTFSVANPQQVAQHQVLHQHHIVTSQSSVQSETQVIELD